MNDQQDSIVSGLYGSELESLLSELLTTTPSDAKEGDDLTFTLNFVRRNPECRSRHCPEAHLTGSAFLVHPTERALLLIHHAKLDRWLQPGGHMAPGEVNPANTALREATEETGVRSLARLGSGPLDIDSHAIPAKGSEPMHQHLDVRYAFLVQDPSEARACETETRGLQWFSEETLFGPNAEALRLDPAFLRAAKKALVLAHGPAA